MTDSRQADHSSPAPIDPKADLDIVQRALAVLDEEVRAWLGPPPVTGPPVGDAAAPGTPAPPEGSDGR